METNNPSPEFNWFSTKGTLTAAGLILLVATAIAYYWPMETEVNQNQQPLTNQDEMADWKTYTNTEYGFEFKYPDNLSFNQGSKISGMYYVYQVPGPKCGQAYPESAELCSDLIVIPSKRFQRDPLDKIIAVTNLNQIKFSYEGHNNVSTQELKTDSNEVVLEVIIKDMSGRDYHGSYYANYYILKGDYIYEFRNFIERNRPELIKVISTFKFTDSIHKPVISNSSGSVIIGKTKANYMVWAYKAGQLCLSRNSFATYGADQAEVDGNFSIAIPSIVSSGKVNIVVAAFDENSIYVRQGSDGTDACFPSTNISETAIFTVSR